MANKKTIAQLELELVRLHRRLTHTVRNIDERRELIKKIRMGKVKQPLPPGKKMHITLQRTTTADLPDDELPTFGSTPNPSFD